MKQCDELVWNVWECSLPFYLADWDIALQTLVLFMGIDWITGGILLPVIFKKSPKSENGRLESRAGWKGLCRKGMTLLFVLIAVRLDLFDGDKLSEGCRVHCVYRKLKHCLFWKMPGLWGCPFQKYSDRQLTF